MIHSEILTRLLGYLPQLFSGALTTLGLSCAALACGFFAGVFIYTLGASRNLLLSGFARVYVSLFRGTPMLAQLLLFYYAPTAFGVNLPGILSAALALTLNTAAYQSQILGSGFASIPRGQVEAAFAFNLSKRQTLWRIEVPQVIRLTLPALVSEMIDVVKASAVISVIAVTDLMRVSQQLASVTYRPFEVYPLAACFYLAITTILSLGGRALEQHYATRS